jgi:regulator of protease activity HflC (stomatin/prohibitin superfamily)
MARLGVAIVREYERGVVFRLGKIRKVRDPGIRFMIPFADDMLKVSLRTITKPIQSQQITQRSSPPKVRRSAPASWRRPPT